MAVVVGLWQWLLEHSGGSGCRAMAVVARAFWWQLLPEHSFVTVVARAFLVAVVARTFFCNSGC